MASVGYATLEVIPSMKGIESKLQSGLTGPDDVDRHEGRADARLVDEEVVPEWHLRDRHRPRWTVARHKGRLVPEGLDRSGSRVAEGDRADQGGHQVDRRRRECHREADRQPRQRHLAQDWHRRRGDPVQREHAADLQERPQRGRQGQRHLQPGHADGHRHVRGARSGCEVLGDPARQGAERPGQGHHGAVAGRCHVRRPAEEADHHSGRAQQPARRAEDHPQGADLGVRWLGCGSGHRRRQDEGRLGQPARRRSARRLLP
jgi:hypothetical protein